MKHIAYWLSTLVVIQSAATTWGQPVQGDVRSVGFQASTFSGFVAREGQWTPILVELTAQGQVFQGRVRCELHDLDGDRVDYFVSPVAVTPGAGVKRIWCYAAYTAAELSVPQKLDVISDDGRRLATIDVPATEVLTSDVELIVDISERAVRGLLTLNRSDNDYASLPHGDTEYYRGICVATLPARNLPDRWIGLETAEVIVWDEPRPDALSIAQIDALRRWVENGGRLVLGLGAAWPQVATGAMADLLPFSTDGARIENITELPALADWTAGSRTSLNDPAAVVVANPAHGAIVLRKDRLPGGAPLNLIAQRFVGSGRVIACATRLSDISRVALPAEFWPEVFDLNPRTPAFNKNEADSLRGAPRLYDAIVEPIEFRRAAGLLAIVAAAFVALYIVVSTVVSWAWLRRRHWTHASWAVFAAFATVASVLSLLTVGLMRGVGDRVATFSFVDMKANSNEARARVYLGYKSAGRQRVDLALNCEGGTLRPLTARGSDIPYATPDRYLADALGGRLLRVPTRATLKQFEGAWFGRAAGAVTARLTADRATGRITADSWVRNNLGVRITGGYLLYIDPRLSDPMGGVPRRVAGLTRRTDRADLLGSATIPPPCNVLVAQIPALDDGAQVSSINASQYENVDRRYAAWSRLANPNPRNEPLLPTLWEAQNDGWKSAYRITGVFSALSRTQSAAYLCSTRNFFLNNNYSRRDFNAVGDTFSTRGLPNLDVTHWLAGGATGGAAVLLLFSEQPAPVSLVRDGRDEPLRVESGAALYRVRVPIRYVNAPPLADAAAAPAAPEGDAG